MSGYYSPLLMPARTTALLTLALAAVVTLSLLGASSALAVGGGSITGTVTDFSSEAPVAQIQVCAYRSPGFEYAGCQETAVDGSYAIAGLTAGNYKVQFRRPFFSEANYLAQYYDGKPTWDSANVVTVSEGSAKTGVDAELHVGGQIAGTVVAAAGEAPLASISACAYVATGPGELAGCAATDADGEYTISGLPSGSYKVQFEPGFGVNFVTQYYAGKATREAADPIAVVAGTTVSSIDAKMQVGGTIAGQVTDAESSLAIEGAEACLYRAGSTELARCVPSGGDGKYSITGLATGSYKVGFKPGFGDQTHARQYYDGKATLAAADAIAVTQGATAGGIDAALVEQGGIAGRVTAASGGAPLVGIEVCASSSGLENSDSGCDLTDAGGDYLIVGLQENSSYRVEFKGGPDHVTEYYDGKSSNLNATPVAVVNATTTGAIDAALETAGKISGKVVDATSKAALQNIEVCAQTPSGSPVVPGACALTGADGKYTIKGLAGGSYSVRFSVPFFNIPNYLTQFYDGREREGEANAVAVVAGATTPAIDAEMHPGGAIEGKVVDAAGKAALQGVEVCATAVSVRRSASRNPIANCDSTDAGGEYRIERLPTNSYRVRFSPGFSLHGYLSQYYDGVATKKLATPVAVTAGGATDGIDAELRQGSRIEGTVIDAVTKSPLQWINVCLRGNFESCVSTGADGKYAIEGLTAGSYKIGFFSSFQTPGYLGQYYDGKASRDLASPVIVGEAAVATGIDAELGPAGAIAGTVTDALSGLGADSIQACAYEAGSGEFVACDNTDADGEYAIEGLTTGSYKVKFSPGNELGGPGMVAPNFNYVTQYYDGASSFDTAAAVAVTAGVTVPHIDAAMAEGGQIEGRVVDAVTKAPTPYTSACVYDPDEGEYSHCSTTDPDGDYRIEGLASGSYKVRFWSSGGYEGDLVMYLPRFYDGQGSEATATAVAVTAPSAHTGVDAELHAGGAITGRVTAASDGVPLAFVFACALEPGGDEEPLSCDETNGNGEYGIAGLATGSYKVSFEALNYDEEGLEEAISEEEFATQYYDSKALRANAKLVAVTAGGPATTGIDARMVEGPAGPEPEDGGGTSGGDSAAGSGSGLVAPSPAPPAQATPPIRRVVPLKCKKGFQKKAVHGKAKCVKAKKRVKKRK
jgi:hypothetical protein